MAERTTDQADNASDDRRPPAPEAGSHGAPDAPPNWAAKAGGRAQTHRTRVGEDDLTDWAAALTYYAVLSIFPGLLVLVSVLGLLGQSAINH